MKKTLAILLVTAAIMPTIAQAEDSREFVVGVQYFNVLDNGNTAAGIRLEGRDTAINTDYTFGIEDIKPFAGVDISTDGAFYAYTGILYEIELDDRWSISPNVAAGAYSSNDGEGQSLGGVFNLRSGLDLSYKYCDNSKISLTFHHFSNASIYDENPGMETVALTYSFAF